MRKTRSTDAGNTKVKASMTHREFERLDHGDPKFDPLRKPATKRGRGPIALPTEKLRRKSA